MMVKSVTNHRKRVKPKTLFGDIRTPDIFLLPIPTGFSNFVDGPAPMITFQINHDSLLANDRGMESWINFWDRAIEHDRFRSNGPGLEAEFGMCDDQFGPCVMFGLGAHNPQIEQIDINPVAAVEGTSIAVDATVNLKTDFKKDIRTNV